MKKDRCEMNACERERGPYTYGNKWVCPVCYNVKMIEFEILQKQFVVIENLERKMRNHHKRCYQLYTLGMEIEICSYCMSFITEITDIKQEIRNTILKERREANND